MTAEDPEADENGYYGPSRSMRKRNAADLKVLGDELVALPAAELEALPLEEKLRDAIDLARRITAHGAAARQRQLIGKILRHTDVEALRLVIERRALEKRLAAREFHRLESWRERLLTEGEAAIAALLGTAPGIDVGELRRLVAAAAAESTRDTPPAAARALFRFLRESLPGQPGSA